MIKAITSIFIVVLMISSVSWAEGGQRSHRRGPPPEAISACKGQSEGASCSFKSPHGELSGTCATVKEGDFACRPANSPQGRGGGQGGGRDKPPPPPSEDSEWDEEEELLWLE